MFVLLGNLGKVDYISEFEYDLYIRPDTCNPKLGFADSVWLIMVTIAGSVFGLTLA